jgi:hypothetical protein
LNSLISLSADRWCGACRNQQLQSTKKRCMAASAGIRVWTLLHLVRLGLDFSDIHLLVIVISPVTSTCNTCNRGSRALSSGVSTTYAPSSVAVVTCVLTVTYGLQVTSLTLIQCSTVSLYLNTSQTPGEVPPLAPYSLIIYPAGGVPSVFPLTLSGPWASWTVDFPVGEPHYLTQALLDCASQHRC